MSEALEARPDVKEKILEVLKSYDAIMLATTGGEYSPWILGFMRRFGSLKFHEVCKVHKVHKVIPYKVCKVL